MFNLNFIYLSVGYSFSLCVDIFYELNVLSLGCSLLFVKK